MAIFMLWIMLLLCPLIICIEFLEENFEKWSIIVAMSLYGALFVFFSLAFVRLMCLISVYANAEYHSNFCSLMAQYFFAMGLLGI